MYNYASAFTKPSGPTDSQIKEIGLATIIAYKHEFPDVEYIEVNFYFETKHVEAVGGPEPRLYSWKSLGFENL